MEPTFLSESSTAVTGIDMHMAAHIMIVDDDRRILEALRRSLRGEPYKVHMVESGPEALETLSTRNFQVVLTDIGMPGMDGITFLERVAHSCPDAVRMVLSGKSSAQTIIQAIQTGDIYRYILKPWNDDELKATIRQALSLWHLQEERKHLMRLLDHRNKELESRVDRRTKQVQSFERQAEIGRHAAQIVHNLNNPLHALINAIDLLSLYTANGAYDPKKIERGIGYARNAAGELKTIVNGILSYVRQDACSPHEPVEVNLLIEEQLKLFEMMPDFKRLIEKKVCLDPCLPAVMGNPIEIKQILSNLLKNSLDAMEQSPHKRLTVRTYAEARDAVIVIADTGEGISSSHHHRVFDPDFTTKSASRGTGLGLASVKTMVDAYGGKIDFESTRGKGATFRVVLPGAKISGSETDRSKNENGGTT